ncbi:hypothetical protein JHK87_000941 [Glycine soja]|nr:hypothetical protein JHK87_000941 [Glycine soja]
MMEYLYFQGNSLQGSIPSSLATLKSLQHLDLSRLSGSIPNVLQNIFFLEYFSVSFNLLDGEVPTKGVFQNASGFVVTSTLIFVEVFQNYIYHHALSKPSNVLLDDGMIARVSDLGVARIISTINGTSSTQTSIVGMKGTTGYAPLEYGMGSKVSMNGDMYSFEILMLEMLTGRRPTDEIFKNGENLHHFVENSFPNNLLQILHQSLIPKQGKAIIEEENTCILAPTIGKCLVSVFKIGLACSAESPKERMNTVDVTRELSKIRKVFYPGKIN